MEFSLRSFGSGDDYRKRIVGDPKDTVLQIGFSLFLGLIAFITFSILRPRWPSLYAARKRSSEAAGSLPELPNTLFGWLPTLFRISEAQVLHSAGLDAYVFLSFFKMAIKYLAIALLISLAIIKPVHDHYPDRDGKHGKNKTEPALGMRLEPQLELRGLMPWRPRNDTSDGGSGGFLPTPDFGADYLWMYLVFAYFFTFLAMYFVVIETKKIIAVRQAFLGGQSTLADRTIRLSGIPGELQSEELIKETMEELDIGTVENVVLCKDWSDLDDAMGERMSILRRLEEAWTVYLGHRRVERSLETLPIAQPQPPGPIVDSEGREDDPLLPAHTANGNGSSVPYARSRPQTRVWYGPLKLRYRTVDAIDYYEEQLRRVDQRVNVLRNKKFRACSLAFVTFNSVSAAQMVTQAVVDSAPMQLLASPCPAPGDIVWKNTYLSRSQRMTRAWSITAFIVLLTLLWSAILVPVAGLIDLDRITSVWPALGEALSSHALAKSLVQTQLPTLIASLLNVLIPYFYWWLSTQQGMISQGDVELSAISKNWFFLFVNFFLIFTTLGTLALTPDNFGNQTPRQIADELATSIQELRNFYVNYIILQGLGLFPVKLLELGSIILYPIGLFGAKTPRDYAEAVQAPMFSYGFYLPQNILIFLICIIYSSLRNSWQVILAGLIYFVIGFYVHKFQLLYSMDHRQQSTGRAWTLICDRIVVGLLIFQVTMAGQLALRGAVKRSLLIIPLVAATVWFSIVFTHTFKPLMKFIALRSIRTAEHAQQENSRVLMDRRRQVVEDESRYETRYVNPNLVAPLENVWIADVIKSIRAESIISPRPGSPELGGVEDVNPWAAVRSGR